MRSNTIRPRRSVLALAVSAALISSGLHAQSEEDSQEESEKGLQTQAAEENKELLASSAMDIDEVIVVGQKFQNSLVNRLPIAPEKLPFSLDVIDEADILERGFMNPLDIIETLPNVVRRQTQLLPTGGSYLIRGLYATALTNNRPENDSRGAGRRDSSQIERIEVMKGPASVLLGPVIPGGVINQVTKSPEQDDFSEVILRGGSYGTHRLEADLNEGALFNSEIWSGRITFAYESQQSPQDEEYTDLLSVRPVIEANFSERTRLQAAVSITEREGSPGSIFPVNTDGSVPEQIDEETYFGIPSKQKGKDTFLDFELQHEFLDNLKLVVRGSQQETDFDYQTSQGGYNYSGGRGFSPGDTLAYVYYSVGYRDTEVKYQDVQLVGAVNLFDRQHDWVIGASHQETKFASYWAFGGVLGVVDLNDIEGAVYGTPDYDLELTPYRDQSDKLSSIYAEANLYPTDKLTIVAGVRYDDYEATNEATGDKTPTDDTTVRVGATYSLTEDFNTYVSYAQGFVPQGGTTRSGNFIEPETAVNYEIGVKGWLLDNRISLTAAAFWLTRENVATTDPNNMPGDPPYVIATGEQQHDGYEVNATFAIADGLDLQLGYGYVDAEITEVISPGTGEDVGDPVALVPNHTYSAFSSYTFQDGWAKDFKLGIGVRAISDRPAPRFDLEYDGYTLFDAVASYPVNENFLIQLNVLNLFDEEYRENLGWNNGTQASGHRFGNPRSAYLTLQAKF